MSASVHGILFGNKLQSGNQIHIRTVNIEALSTISLTLELPSSKISPSSVCMGTEYVQNSAEIWNSAKEKEWKENILNCLSYRLWTLNSISRDKKEVIRPKKFERYRILNYKIQETSCPFIQGLLQYSLLIYSRLLCSFWSTSRSSTMN